MAIFFVVLALALSAALAYVTGEKCLLFRKSFFSLASFIREKPGWEEGTKKVSA